MLRTLIIYIALSLGICQFANAQFIVPGKFIEQSYPTFNQDSVAHRELSSITIRIMRKPSMRPIYDDGKRLRYDFDRSGRIIYFQKVFPEKHQRMDTTARQYFYQGEHLLSETEIIGTYRRMTQYEQKEGLTSRKVLIKRGDSEWTMVSDEIVTEKQINKGNKRILVQEIGAKGATPYQRIIEEYTMDQRLTLREVWTGSRAMSIELLSWSGGLIESYSFSDLIDNESMRYEYAIENAKQDEGRRCLNNECRNWSIVYLETGIPKGIIFMDAETEDMEIWEFRYEYR